MLSLWLLWVPALAFLAGLAWDGLGGGVLAATLSFLVVGPLHLGRRWWLRRTGRIPPPTPRTPAEQAPVIRLGVVASVIALGCIARLRSPGRALTPPE